MGQFVLRVLERAMSRAPQEPERATSELAMEEMGHVITDWFAHVLQEPSVSA